MQHFAKKGFVGGSAAKVFAKTKIEFATVSASCSAVSKFLSSPEPELKIITLPELQSGKKQ